MKRHAFKMKLKPGVAVEYQKRHDAIWPELAAELKAAGISDYSIFLDEETMTLFAVQKLSEPNTAAKLPQTAILRKWWEYMAPLMEVHADNSPVEGTLREVFHLE
jgi:L-rhamnose mutarotase